MTGAGRVSVTPSTEHSTQNTSPTEADIKLPPAPVTSPQLPFPIYNFHPQHPVTLGLGPRVSVTSCYTLHIYVQSVFRPS